MLKFAICDDEPLMIKEISDRISSYMEEKHLACTISCFSSGQTLLKSGCDFDLIFLDIQMEPPDGMETARLLRQRSNRSLLIFVTVLKELVFDAFAVQAYDYLIKPLDGARFHQTMERAVRSLTQRNVKNVVVQKGSSCEVIPLSQITYCEVQGRKIYIHRQDKNVIDYYDKLDDLVRRVDDRFFRCHRSYLVNLDYVRGYSAGQITLSQGDSVPVSRLRERELTQALLRRIKQKR